MNTVLFDLDGTLLPIDMKDFVDTFMELLKGYLTSRDFNPDDIVPSIWKAIGAMEVNDGLITNEEMFWKVLMEDLSSKDESYDKKFRRRFQKSLDKFYTGDFQMIRYMVRPSQECHDAVMMLKEKGYRIVLATKPMFPEIAVKERLSWLGFSLKDFDYVTTYENSCYTKPNKKYYEHILKIMDKDPGDCLMVGNDVKEDMFAAEMGIDVFLIEDYMLNPDNDDTSMYKSGNWKLFKEYVNDLPKLN
ncbi:MAG: HAD family hydrolase [Eubacterium sp.]|nr:HAD family hydrolase [Eubacterium sp.]